MLSWSFFIRLAISGLCSVGSLGELLDGLLESGGVGADDLLGLLALLEEEEGGHGADAKLLAHVGDLIDVNLDKVDLAVLLLVGEVDKDGGNGLAGTAPGGEGINDDEVMLLQGSVELGLVVNVVDNHVGRRSVEVSVGRWD